MYYASVNEKSKIETFLSISPDFNNFATLQLKLKILKIQSK